MIALVLEALAGIAVSLAILMAIAWMVPRRAGNSGGVDTIWTFSVGLVGAGSAQQMGRQPLPDEESLMSLPSKSAKRVFTPNDPAIHPKNVLRSLMDARVKPAHDESRQSEPTSPAA